MQMGLVLAAAVDYQHGTMPHDPHSQIDQNVLEMIEHSPVGAVPHTPSYQDALKRLRASHQVYVSADHKGGYVSVRSLAAAPCFYAENLAAIAAGKVAVTELEPDASIFDRYVRSLPAALHAKAEACRALVVGRRVQHRAHHGVEVAQGPAHTLFLVPGSGPNPGLPGNYLHGSLLQTTNDAAGGAWTLHLHDSLDGAVVCQVASQSEAFAKLEEVVASAPFLLSELDSLGFRLV